MNFQSLQAFVAIAQTQSFSRAAERLHLSQPAISKRIAVLESQLNAMLFDRNGRNIGVTEAGRILLPRAERLLLEMQQTQTEIENLSGEVTGKLRFGTSHHIGMHRLPNHLKAFSQQFPKVELDIEFLESEDASDRVEKGDLEFALVTLPAKPSARLVTQVVWTDQLHIVKSRQQRTDETELKTWLNKTKAILPTQETETRRIIEQHLGALDIMVDALIETNNLETIKKMVEIGLGWSVLPEIMLDANLSVLSLSDTPLERSLGLVMNSSRTLSNAGAALLQAITPPPQ